MFTLKQELLRKLVHLSSIIYPILYFFLSKQTMIYLFSIIFMTIIFFEILRMGNVSFPGSRIFNIVIRPDEIKNTTFSGAVSFILACLLITIIFSKYIVILSIFILVICDTSASFTGRTIGKNKIFDKSLEGFLAFVLSGIIVISIFHYFTPYNNIKFFILLYGVIAASISELFSKLLKVDDNLLITIVFATTIQYFTL